MSAHGFSMLGSVSNMRGALSPGASAYLSAGSPAAPPVTPAEQRLPQAASSTPAAAPLAARPVSPPKPGGARDGTSPVSLRKHHDITIVEARAPLLPLAQDAKQLPFGTGLQGGEAASLKAHVEAAAARAQEASTRAAAKQQRATATKEAVCTEALAFFEVGAAARAAVPPAEAAQLTTAFLTVQQASLARTRSWASAWGAAVASITSSLERRASTLAALLDALYVDSLVAPVFDGGATPPPPAALSHVSALAGSLSRIDEGIKGFNPISSELKGAIEAAVASCGAHSSHTVALTNAFLSQAAANNGSNKNAATSAAVASLGLFVKELQALNDGEVGALTACQRAAHTMSGWWRGGIVAGAVCAEGPHVLNSVRRAVAAIERHVEALHPTLIEHSRSKIRTGGGNDRGRSTAASGAANAPASPDAALWPMYAGFSGAKKAAASSSPPRSPPRTTITGGGGGTTIVLGASGVTAGSAAKATRKRPALAALSPLVYEAAASVNVAIPSPWLQPEDAAAADAAVATGSSSPVSPKREAVTAAGKFGDVVALARMRRRGSWSGTSSVLPVEEGDAVSDSPRKAGGASAGPKRSREAAGVQGLLSLARITVAFASTHAAKTLAAWKDWCGAWDAAFEVEALATGLAHDAAVAAMQGPTLLSVAGLPTLTQFAAARVAAGAEVAAGGAGAAAAVGSLLTPRALAARLKASRGHVEAASAALGAAAGASAAAREGQVARAMEGGAARPCVALLLHSYLTASEPDALLTAQPASLLAPAPVPPVTPPTALGRYVPLHAVRRLGDMDEQVKLNQLSHVDGSLLHGWLPRGTEAGETLWGGSPSDDDASSVDEGEVFLGEHADSEEIDIIEHPGGHHLPDHEQEAARHVHSAGVTAVLTRPVGALSPVRSPRRLVGGRPAPSSTMDARRAEHVKIKKALAAARKDRSVISAGVEAMRRAAVELAAPAGLASDSAAAAASSVPASKAGYLHCTPPLQEMTSVLSTGTDPAHVYVNTLCSAALPGMHTEPPPRSGKRGAASAALAAPHPSPASLLAGLLCGCGRCSQALARVTEAGENVAMSHGHLTAGVARDLLEAMTGPATGGFGASPIPGSAAPQLAYGGTALPGAAPRFAAEAAGHLVVADESGTRVDVGPGQLVSIGPTGTIFPLAAVPPAARPVAARAIGQSLRLEATRQALLTKPAVTALARLHCGEWGWEGTSSGGASTPPPLPVFKALVTGLLVLGRVVPALTATGAPALKLLPRPGQSITPWYHSVTSVAAAFDALAGVSPLALPSVPPAWVAKYLSPDDAQTHLFGSTSAVAGPLTPSEQATVALASGLVEGNASITGNPGGAEDVLSRAAAASSERVPAWRVVCAAFDEPTVLELLAHDPLLQGRLEALLVQAAAALLAGSVPGRRNATAIPLPLFRSPRGDDAKLFRCAGAVPLGFSFDAPGLSELEATLLTRRGVGAAIGPWEAAQINAPLMGKSPRSTAAPTRKGLKQAVSTASPAVLVVRGAASCSPSPAASPLSGSMGAASRQARSVSTFTLDDAVFLSPSDATSGVLGGNTTGANMSAVGRSMRGGMVALVPAVGSPALGSETGSTGGRGRTASLVSLGPVAESSPGSTNDSSGAVGPGAVAAAAAAKLGPAGLPVDDADTPHNAPLYIHSLASRADLLKPLVALVGVAKTRPALNASLPVHVDTIAAWAADIALPTLGPLSPAAAGVFAWAANATATRLHATELGRQLSKAAFGVALEPLTMVAEPPPGWVPGSPAFGASPARAAPARPEAETSPRPAPLAASASTRSPVVIRRLPSTAQLLSGGDTTGVRVRLGVTDVSAPAPAPAPGGDGGFGDEAALPALPLIAGGLGDVAVTMARPEHVLYSPVDPRRLPHINPERAPTARLLANNLEEIDVGAYKEQQDLDTKMRAAIAAKGLTPDEIAARAARRGGSTLLDDEMGLPYADDEDEDDLRAAARVAARKHAEWKAAQKAARKGDKGDKSAAAGVKAGGGGSGESVLSTGEPGEGESMWSAPPAPPVKEYTEAHYEDMEAGDGDIVFSPDGAATLVLRQKAGVVGAGGTVTAPA